MGTCSIGQWHRFELEVDLVNNSYNLYIDDELQADFTTLGAESDRSIGSLTISADQGVFLDNLYGLSYLPTESELIPYTLQTFIDEDFADQREFKPSEEPCQNH